MPLTPVRNSPPRRFLYVSIGKGGEAKRLPARLDPSGRYIVRYNDEWYGLHYDLRNPTSTNHDGICSYRPYILPNNNTLAPLLADAICI